MNIIPASLYYDTYIIAMSIIALAQVLYLNGRNAHAITCKRPSQGDNIKAFALSLALVLFFGFRNPFDQVFADTVGYASRYFSIATEGKSSSWYVLSSASSEIIWNNILIYCGLNKLGIYTWFTIVAGIYIFGTYYAVKKIFPNNVFLGCTFAFLNFGFYSGAINGIRNANALAFVLIAMSYAMVADKNLRQMLIVILLLIVAYFIHHSAILRNLSVCVNVCH